MRGFYSEYLSFVVSAFETAASVRTCEKIESVRNSHGMIEDDCEEIGGRPQRYATKVE